MLEKYLNVRTECQAKSASVAWRNTPKVAWQVTLLPFWETPARYGCSICMTSHLTGLLLSVVLASDSPVITLGRRLLTSFRIAPLESPWSRSTLLASSLRNASPQAGPPVAKTLISWKEIGQYLGNGVRTVQRGNSRMAWLCLRFPRRWTFGLPPPA